VNPARCDLHLHSSASKHTHEWYSRIFGCAESYVDPVKQYELCKARGMTFVTLTDHDTISGGLQLLDRPDFFLSEEVTTRFPENDCVMHVLVWNIDPDQHHAIQERREDIYHLIDYLERHEIAHGLAHPLLSPNWRLDVATLEKVLVLFPTLELVNGMTDARIQRDLEQLLRGLDEEVIAALAAKHQLRARGSCPHRKALTGGSDDHVRRRSGNVFTEVMGPVTSPAEFLRRCLAGEGRVGGKPGDLNAVGLAIHNTTYEFLRQRRGPERPTPCDPFTDLSDIVAARTCAREGVAGDRAPPDRFVGELLSFAARAQRGGRGVPDPLEIPAQPSDREDSEIVGAFSRVVDVGICDAITALALTPLSFDLYRGLDALRSLTCSVAAASPFLFGADHFARQWAQVKRVRAGWSATPWSRPTPRLALFSDSLDQLDGVATWCQRFVERARLAGFEAVLPYCGEITRHPQAALLQPLPAAASFPLPLYAGMQLYVPSLLGTLDCLWRQEITNVELATPGPMGLVGLLAARLMRLPVTATYHTAVPALASLLEGSSWMGTAARRLLGWFYNRVDTVFVYSQAAQRELVEMGVSAERVVVLPATVDPCDFSPDFGSPEVFREIGVDVGDRPVVLSVGRLSTEKNIPVIVDAVEALQGRASAPVLVVVGDGPERDSLQGRFGGNGFAHFVGRHTGQTLRRLYASSQAFVFASRVDTLGLVNLEAMASGIPVLIPTDASAAELADHAVSAEFYAHGVEGLVRALDKVLYDRAYADRLGTNARSAMVERWKRAPFEHLWELFTGAA
jgi:glycosyltransferase involved in cell wall biosynthesis